MKCHGEVDQKHDDRPRPTPASKLAARRSARESAAERVIIRHKLTAYQASDKRTVLRVSISPGSAASSAENPSTNSSRPAPASTMPSAQDRNCRDARVSVATGPRPSGEGYNTPPRRVGFSACQYNATLAPALRVQRDLAGRVGSLDGRVGLDKHVQLLADKHVLAPPAARHTALPAPGCRLFRTRRRSANAWAARRVRRAQTRARAAPRRRRGQSPCRGWPARKRGKSCSSIVTRTCIWLRSPITTSDCPMPQLPTYSPRRTSDLSMSPVDRRPHFQPRQIGLGLLDQRFGAVDLGAGDHLVMLPRAGQQQLVLGPGLGQRLAGHRHGLPRGDHAPAQKRPGWSRASRGGCTRSTSAVSVASACAPWPRWAESSSGRGRAFDARQVRLGRRQVGLAHGQLRPQFAIVQAEQQVAWLARADLRGLPPLRPRPAAASRPRCSRWPVPPRPRRPPRVRRAPGRRDHRLQVGQRPVRAARW